MSSSSSSDEQREAAGGLEDAAALAEGAELRRTRMGTWTDSELEDLYDINTMSETTAMKAKHLLQVMKATRHCVKAQSLDAAINVVVESTCKILGCDGATLFIVDAISNQLVIRRAVGLEDIRIPLDTSSIAGSVYHSGTKLNIANAYEDERFNRSTDDATGYTTRSILCCAVYDANYEPVAVLQAVNKLAKKKEQGDQGASSSDDQEKQEEVVLSSRESEVTPIEFSKEDEVLMDHLSLQLGVILRQQMLRVESERSHAQVLSLLDIVRSLHSNMGLNSLMFTITERTPSLVDADRCTLFVVDRKHQELFSLQGAIEIRAPLTVGLVGHSASTGKVINIDDAHLDSRFNTEFDLKTGFRTKSVLVLPIFGTSPIGANASDKPEVIGVLQIINKLHGPRFTDEDEALLGSFLEIVGSLLSTSQLFNPASKPATSEFGAAQDILSFQPPLAKRHGSSGNLFHGGQEPIVEEEDDEAEEDRLQF